MAKGKWGRRTKRLFKIVVYVALFFAVGFFLRHMGWYSDVAAFAVGLMFGFLFWSAGSHFERRANRFSPWAGVEDPLEYAAETCRDDLAYFEKQIESFTKDRDAGLIRLARAEAQLAEHYRQQEK